MWVLGMMSIYVGFVGGVGFGDGSIGGLAGRLRHPLTNAYDLGQICAECGKKKGEGADGKLKTCSKCKYVGVWCVDGAVGGD